MNVEDTLRTKLVNTAEVYAVIGNRIYPHKLPQKPIYPAVTYFRVSNYQDRILEGSISLERPRIEFDVYALSYAECKNTFELLKSNLQAIQMMLPTGSVIIDTSIEPEQEFYEENEALAQIYRTQFDVFVWHNI